MVEAAVSMVLVGVTLVAALSTVGASRYGLQKTADHAVGRLLAQALMSEILGQHYSDPNSTPAFGRELGEAGDDRASLDDVDDYDGWTASPPQYQDGTDIPNREAWERTVSVDFVAPDDLNTRTLTDTGAKRITVTVTHNKLVVASVTAVQTKVAAGAQRGEVIADPPEIGPPSS